MTKNPELNISVYYDKFILILNNQIKMQSPRLHLKNTHPLFNTA
jgi:hypothetical protein